MDDKESVTAEISRLLGTPHRLPSRGGTITRPFLEDVASALSVRADDVDKLELMQRLVTAVGQPWDHRCSSEHTPSGGGGNITLLALQRLLEGIRARQKPVAVEQPAPPAALDDVGSAWRRDFDAVAREMAVEGHLDVESLEEASWRTFSSIAQRRGPAVFWQSLYDAYEGRCAVTGATADTALEAAHVVPYLGTRTNVVSNGLLLRADVHTLFDLGLIGVHPYSRQVVVSSVLASTPYEAFAGQALHEPTTPAQAPTEAVLLWRAEHIGPAAAMS